MFSRLDKDKNFCYTFACEVVMVEEILFLYADGRGQTKSLPAEEVPQALRSESHNRDLIAVIFHSRMIECQPPVGYEKDRPRFAPSPLCSPFPRRGEGMGVRVRR